MGGSRIAGVPLLLPKLISLFEPTAQILRRGKPHRPTEFGKLVKVQEAEGGVVTDIEVVDGKSDIPTLVPSVEQHICVFGKPPHLVATDRGYYSTRGVEGAQQLGVRRVVVPKPGHKSRSRTQHERQRWFRHGHRWRTGGEARISRLKNTFGMHRSRYRGERGIERTAYWPAIANNLAAVAKAEPRASAGGSVSSVDAKRVPQAIDDGRLRSVRNRVGSVRTAPRTV